MVKFLGVARLKFTSQDTGEVIKGWNFWFNEPNENEESIGYKPFKKFVGDKALDAVVSPHGGLQGMKMFIDKDCTVIYNQYGKITDIQFSASK